MAYLQQTEPLTRDQTQRVRLGLRIALEVVRDVFIARRDACMASAMYDIVGQEIANFPEIMGTTPPECGIALAVQRLLLPYRTA
jgi:hypothetical protein